jgi:hypothetical protein
VSRKAPKRKIIGLFVSAILPVSMLTGCGQPKVMLPPNADFYVLDLSDSGSADDQFERISQDVVRSLTRSSLGQPFEVDSVPAYGPTITTFSFVGSNSRFLKTFQLQDYEKVDQLFDIVKEDTRAQKSWEKLTATYQSVLEPQLDSNNPISFSSYKCESEFDFALKDYFSGTQTRADLVDKLCQMATFTISKYRDLTKYIAEEKSQHKLSDVFGAIELVNNSVESILEYNPSASVKLTLATDGENYLGPNNALNTSSLLRAGDPCKQGELLFKRLSVKSLQGIKVELPGIGALIGNNAEYAGQVDKFWRCFFAPSI